MNFVQELPLLPNLKPFDLPSLKLTGYGRNSINGVAFTSNDGKSTTGFNYSFGIMKPNEEGKVCFDMRFIRKHKILPPYLHNKPTEFYHIVEQTFNDLKNIGVELFRARLSLLPAGATIPEHQDSPQNTDYCIKVHIPLITNPSARFIFNDQRYKMDVGKIYIANVAPAHSFINPEPHDRYHIIADAIVHNRDLPFYCENVDGIMAFYKEWEDRRTSETCEDRWLSQPSR